MQAQRQARNDTAELAAAQAELAQLCRDMCAAGGAPALAGNGVPAGLTPMEPREGAAGRRGGRGRTGDAAPAEGRVSSSAEAGAGESIAKCDSRYPLSLCQLSMLFSCIGCAYMSAQGRCT